jgi:Beta-lactamase
MLPCLGARQATGAGLAGRGPAANRPRPPGVGTVIASGPNVVVVRRFLGSSSMSRSSGPTPFVASLAAASVGAAHVTSPLLPRRPTTLVRRNRLPPEGSIARVRAHPKPRPAPPRHQPSLLGRMIKSSIPAARSGGSASEHYRIASVSKTVTALGVLRLVPQERMLLRAPAESFRRFSSDRSQQSSASPRRAPAVA